MRTPSLVSAVAIAVALLTGGSALAQDDPRSAPPAEQGLVALQTETMLLVELGGFALPVDPFVQHVHTEWASFASGMSRSDLLSWLDDVDQDGADALAELRAGDQTVSLAVGTALGRLPGPQRERLDSDATIAVPPREYSIALHDLEERGGAPRLPSAIPGAGATAAVGTAGESPPPLAPQATAASEDDRLGVRLAGLLAVVGLAAGGGLLAWRRRRTGDTDASSAPSSTPDRRRPLPVGGAPFEELLETSRRMTAALDSDEVVRIAVEQAIRLARAAAGAFVRVTDGPHRRLEVATGTPDLLNEDRLDQGELVRVAETGQPLRVVSHDEPALRSLPVALLVMPVIGRGQVSGMLVVAGDGAHPFDADDETVLRQLAPMVASALAAAEQHDSVTTLSFQDGLTSLSNRRGLDQDLPVALAACRPGSATTVAMVDVDHFKAFNDTNGHANGDAALVAVADVLRREVREHAYRYGGEEFTLILRDVTAAESRQVLERVREHIEATPVDGEQHLPDGTLTASIGAVVVPAGPTDADEALRLADEALYRSKRAGRNRVTLDEAPAPAAD